MPIKYKRPTRSKAVLARCIRQSIIAGANGSEELLQQIGETPGLEPEVEAIEGIININVSYWSEVAYENQHFLKRSK